jgi:hypothetical protein
MYLSEPSFRRIPKNMNRKNEELGLVMNCNPTRFENTEIFLRKHRNLKKDRRIRRFLRSWTPCNFPSNFLWRNPFRTQRI